MLAYFLRKVRPQRFGARPRVVIAVPGSLTAVEKRAVYSSAQRAGSTGVSHCPSEGRGPGAGLPITEPLGNLIVDIGGGTTEVAVLSVSGVVAHRSLRVGGDQMDQALVDHLRRRYGLRIGPAAAERLRIDGGSAPPLEEEQAEEVAGVDIASGLPRRVTVTSPELRKALAESLDRIVDAIRETVDNCGADLAADLVTHGMVLTGGARCDRSTNSSPNAPAFRPGWRLILRPPWPGELSFVWRISAHGAAPWSRPMTTPDSDSIGAGISGCSASRTDFATCAAIHVAANHAWAVARVARWGWQ